MTIHTPLWSPSFGDWREHDKNVYDLCCQIDRDAVPAVIILHFNHADAAAYYYHTPRHIISCERYKMLHYYYNISSAFVNMV